MKGLKVVLTIFFVFSTLLFSCDREEEFYCGLYLPYFEIQGLNVTNLKYINPNYPYPWVVLSGTETVNWPDFFLRTEFKTKHHAAIQKTASGGANLYAFRCPINGDNGSKIGLDTLYVITINDYNKIYKANDTINQIILINDWTTFASDYNTFIPLTQYIRENSDRIKDEHFEIKFTEGPESASNEKRFKIIYKLDNGTVFETITKPVKLY